jgi:hypothetical protein
MLGIPALVAVFLQYNGEAAVLVLNVIRGLVLEPVTVLIFSWNRPISLWYVTFQMAEVAVPRQMFAEILSLIARLRAPPVPA